MMQMFVPFRRLWLVYFFIAGLGLAVLQVQQAFPGPACVAAGYALPWTQCYLGDSTTTPWGIFTGFFVHTSFLYHYVPDMLLLFAVFFVFCVTHALLPRNEKRYREGAFIQLMFVSGIVANVASLLLYGPLPSVGSSGLDFAALGITMVFCAVNIFPRSSWLGEPGSYYRDPLNLVWASTNGFLAAGLIMIAAIFPATFLSVGPGVNVLAHFMSLAFAMGATTIWALATAKPRTVRRRQPTGT